MKVTLFSVKTVIFHFETTSSTTPHQDIKAVISLLFQWRGTVLRVLRVNGWVINNVVVSVALRMFTEVRRLSRAALHT